MRFRPSAYSSAPAYGEPGFTGFVDASALGAVDPAAVAQIGQAAASITESGLSIAKSVEESKKKRRKKKKKSAPASAPAPTPEPMPVAPAPEPVNWMKWGAIGAGVLVLGFLAWKFLKKPEPVEPPPKRIPLKPNRPKPQPRKIRPAPASSVSMFRDEPTEELIEDVVERAHGESYEGEPGEFETGEE